MINEEFDIYLVNKVIENAPTWLKEDLEIIKKKEKTTTQNKLCNF